MCTWSEDVWHNLVEKCKSQIWVVAKKIKPRDLTNLLHQRPSISMSHYQFCRPWLIRQYLTEDLNECFWTYPFVKDASTMVLGDSLTCLIHMKHRHIPFHFTYMTHSLELNIWNPYCSWPFRIGAIGAIHSSGKTELNKKAVTFSVSL